jgi:hypothetical protein
MRYRAGLPLVLRDVTFSVRGGERVGVVGRTGSGKSSLMVRRPGPCPVSGRPVPPPWWLTRCSGPGLRTRAHVTDACCGRGK